MTGRLFLRTHPNVSGNEALNLDQIKGGFVDIITPYVKTRS